MFDILEIVANYVGAKIMTAFDQSDVQQTDYLLSDEVELTYHLDTPIMFLYIRRYFIVVI